MGNCSQKAVTDATEGLDSRDITINSRRNLHGVEVLSAPRGGGVWKVKLVIDPKDLEQILSEEVNTEALIEQMRVAAANSTPKRGKSYGTHSSLMCSFK
ncbi:hypothetical protein CDL12_07163 [Handroanthus impetiginosus]|uniref:Uncharacterized protein n=1 Tax=Handroanthus impetiginosus TaxID=429701 RepID=A0A2G9HRJ3_9LAMI|nr:hypothetical protein CDL12_07163 [Handroanthus impetiginosus]